MAAIFLFVLTFLVDAYISWDLKSSGKKAARKIFNVSALLCWIFLILIICVPKRSESSGIMTVMWMLYTYISIYFAKIGYVACSLIGRLIRRIARIKRNRHISGWIGIAVSTVIFCVMWVGVFYTRNHIVVNRIDIDSRSIPRSFDVTL